MNHWDSPLGLATRHDKARARAVKLREQADDLDAKADEWALRYEEAMAEIARRTRELATNLVIPEELKAGSA